MEYPVIYSLNPKELIDWCNERRKELNISKGRLAEMTGVPESTLDRILSGKNPEFRYSTVQPIVTVLLETESPKEHTAQNDAEYYTTTIEGYKLVLGNKDHIIEVAKREYEQSQKEINFLTNEIEKKNSLITRMQEHIKWMEDLIDERLK